MENNDVENHKYFKVHTWSVIEVYNMKQNYIIQIGDILSEMQEIDDDDEPEKSSKKHKKEG